MKNHRSVILLLFFTFCSVSISFGKDVKSIIRGNIANTPKGHFVYLSDPIHKLLLKSPLQNGSFTFETEVPQFSFSGTLTRAELFFADQPNLSRIQLLKTSKKGPTIILEEKTYISGDYKSGRFKVTGFFNDKLDMFSSLKEQSDLIISQKLELVKNSNQASEEKAKRIFSIRAYYDSQLIQERIGLIARLLDKVALDQLLFQANSSFYGYEKVDSAFNLFNDSLKSSQTGKLIAEAIEIRKQKEKDFLKVGEVFPFSSLPRQNGNKNKVEELKPGLCLVDLWASWCGPCRAEIPYIKDAKKKVSQLQVIAISIDENSSKWKEAITADCSDGFIHLLDNKGWKSEIIKRLSITEIPQNFLINEKGIIVAKNLRNEEIVSAVERYSK